MLKSLKWILAVVYTLNSIRSWSQSKMDGLYVTTDTININIPFEKETIYKITSIRIKGDSIWWIRKTLLNKNQSIVNLMSGGIIRKLEKDYLGSILLMECDTCPKSPKFERLSNFDTVINMGKPSTSSQAVFFNRHLSEGDELRISHLFFKVLPDGNILEFGKIYRKQYN